MGSPETEIVQFLWPRHQLAVAQSELTDLADGMTIDLNFQKQTARPARRRWPRTAGGMMVSTRRRSPAHRSHLATVRSGSWKVDNGNLLFDGTGVRMRCHSQGFAGCGRDPCAAMGQRRVAPARM